MGNRGRPRTRQPCAPRNAGLAAWHAARAEWRRHSQAAIAEVDVASSRSSLDTQEEIALLDSGPQYGCDAARCPQRRRLVGAPAAKGEQWQAAAKQSQQPSAPACTTQAPAREPASANTREAGECRENSTLRRLLRTSDAFPQRLPLSEVVAFYYFSGFHDGTCV